MVRSQLNSIRSCCHTQSFFQNPNFLKSFCPSVLGEEAKNFNQNCLDWIEIAFNNCMGIAFSEPKSGWFWDWMLNLVTKKELTGVTAQNGTFSRPPHNLTTAQCQDFLNTIYQEFINTQELVHLDCDPPQQPSLEKQDENDSMGPWDLVLLFIIAIALIVIMTPIVVADIKEYLKKIRELEVVEANNLIDLSDSEEDDDDGIRFSTDAQLPAESSFPMNDDCQVTQDDNSDYDSEDFKSNESNISSDEETEIGSTEIEVAMKSEKQDSSDPDELDETPNDQIECEKQFSGSTVVRKSSSASLPKSPSKNFINLNIEKVQKPNKTLHSQSCQTPTSSKKSQIPVRSAFPFLKLKKSDKSDC